MGSFNFFERIPCLNGIWPNFYMNGFFEKPFCFSQAIPRVYIIRYFRAITIR
jgi:hypothetical protein